MNLLFIISKYRKFEISLGWASDIKSKPKQNEIFEYLYGWVLQ